MIRIKKITEIDEILELVIEQKYNENINRYRSSYLYRGLPNEKYHLTTSLQRICKNRQQDIEKAYYATSLNMQQLKILN